MHNLARVSDARSQWHDPTTVKEIFEELPRMRGPKKLVLAVPVAPTSTVAELHREADDLICLEDYERFGAIGAYYADFGQVSDGAARTFFWIQ